MNLKIERYLDVIENDDKIKEDDEHEGENSYDKEQEALQQIMLKNLEFEEDMDKNYDKIGVNEKEQVLQLVKKGRMEKKKEEIFQENFELFQDFKQYVIKKERLIKDMNKTQFKNPYNKEDEINRQNLNNLNDMNSKLNNEILNSYNNIYEDNRKINDEEYKLEMQEKYGSQSSKSNKSSKFHSKNIYTDESNMLSNRNFKLPPIDYHNSSNNSKRSSKKSSSGNKNFVINTSSKSK
jgi:hypothetical protein